MSEFVKKVIYQLDNIDIKINSSNVIRSSASIKVKRPSQYKYKSK